MAAVTVAAGEVALAYAVRDSPRSAVTVVVGGFLVLSLAIAPWMLPVTVVPGVWLLRRVGPASVDLSISDALLLIGAVGALWYVPWREPRLRRALFFVGLYLGLLAIAIAAHPTRRAIVEWGHRTYLLGGAVVVGATIAALGKVTATFRLLTVITVAFALRAIADALTSGFVPAYPFGLQKNPAGALFVMVFLILMLAPAVVGLGSHVRLAVMAVVLGGLLATQSRGAAITLVVVAFGLSMQKRRRASARLAALVGAVVAVLFVVSTFDSIGVADKENQFNSYNSRRLTNDYALELWRESPLTGAGVRFFNEPDFFARAEAAGQKTFGEPHNVIVSNLAESGVVGLVALGVLLVGLVQVLRRSPSELSALAITLLAARFINTQFDIWWVAGTLTLPFTVVGMALYAPGDRTPATRAPVRTAMPA